MQGWSWMAALTLVASTSGLFAPAALAAEPPAVKQKVALVLRLDGLSAAGGEVEIKPGHAGCRFEAIKVETKAHRRKLSDGSLVLDPIEVETLSADRDCLFAITLKEAGQPDKTVRRTVRLVPAADGKPAKTQDITFYISSNSLKPPVIAEKPGKPTDDPKRKK